MTFILDKIEYDTNDPDLFRKLRINRAPLHKIRESRIKDRIDEYLEYCAKFDKCLFCDDVELTENLINFGKTAICKNHIDEYHNYRKEIRKKSSKTFLENQSTFTIHNIQYNFDDPNLFEKLTLNDVRASHTPIKIREQFKEYRNQNSKCLHCGKIFNHKDMFIRGNFRFCLEHKDKMKNLGSKISSKIKQSVKEKYNTDYYFKTEEFQLKSKQTKLERYNDENFNNREQAKQTCLDLYGAENVSQLDYIKEKKKHTLNKNYGVDYPCQSEEILDKLKSTNLERYDTEFMYGSEYFKNKVKENNLDRCGTEYYNNFEQTKQTKLERYDNEYYNNRPKYRETSQLKYGVDHPWKRNEIREKCYQTNLERYGTEHYNILSLSNIENYNEQYIRENFIKDGWFLESEFMEYFNCCQPTAKNNKLKYNITEPNKTDRYKTQSFIFNNIKTENKLFNDRSLGFEMDIYLPDQKLAVEYNGLMFHSQGLKTHSMFPGPDFDKNYHLKKTDLCNQNGIQLIHIFEGEDLDLWLSMINNKLGLSKRIFARKCTVREVPSDYTKDFQNLNHIQGFCNAKINLGLFYENQLVQVMTFSKPRFNKNYEYELIRLCSLKNTTVVGGPSKLLEYFKNVYKPKSIISYANRRFSNGSIYEKLGFKLIGESSPNYFYFKPGSTLLESRNKYQKHKLSKLLESFDPNLTEHDNMFNNGYRRIYDCGNLVYELILN